MATRRPDLEALPYKAPPYLTRSIFPMFMTDAKAATVYYQDVRSSASVETSRSAGAAPSATTLTEASTTFTAVEGVKRYNIDDAARTLFGGLAKAEVVGSRLARRAVDGWIEASTAANVLANGSVTYYDILNDIFGAVKTGVETVSDKGAGGRIAFVSSTKVIQRIKAYAAVIDRMKYTGVIADGVRQVRGFGNEVLAACLGVDLILEGPLAEWYTASATYQERAALVVLPDGNMDPLEEIQAGRTYCYQLDEQGNNTMIETYHDDNLVADVVQARVWANQVVLNPELIYGLKGLDELNASSTTTTTTTG